MLLAKAQIFALEPFSTTTLVAGVVCLSFLFGLGWLLIHMGGGLKRIRFTLQADGLRVFAPYYGRLLPWNMLKLDEARVVDLSEEPQINPGRMWRTNGIGLPSCHVGWYRRNKIRVLSYVSSTKNALAVPTTENYTLVVSVQDPHALIAAMQEAARSSLVSDAATHPMFPPARYTWIPYLPAAIVVSIFVLFALLLFGPKSVEVGESTLDVSGAVYGWTLPLDMVETSGVRTVDLAKETDLAPAGRTNGFALGGAREGRFTLASGHPAFVLMTSDTNAVYIPTSLKYDIVVSPQDPQGLIKALQVLGHTDKH